MQKIVDGETYIVDEKRAAVTECPYDPSGCIHKIYGMCPQVGRVTPLQFGLTEGILCKESKDETIGRLTATGTRIV